eukprot:m.68027 g.68027  ORF g.68027 m.68027 type:complete len:362 (+) comp14153_c1_seq2:349-1434(+)
MREIHLLELDSGSRAKLRNSFSFATHSRTSHTHTPTRLHPHPHTPPTPQPTPHTHSFFFFLYTAEMTPLNIFILSIMSGIFIGFGAVASFTVLGGMSNGSPDSLGVMSPGLAKFLGGAIFPLGLMIIVFCGGELFTGNAMFIPVALLARKITWQQGAKSWFFSFFGNFLGCVLHAYFLAYKCRVFADDPWLSFIHKLTMRKIDYDWGEAFLRAVGANMLVCIAIFMVIASESMEGKFFACWWPIMAFFTVGYEHSVANMWTLTVGLMYDTDRTTGQFIGRNLIPVTLGNILGAVIFIFALYYVYHERSQKAIENLHLTHSTAPPARRPTMQTDFLMPELTSMATTTATTGNHTIAQTPFKS